jgi:hypothetical protein
MIPHFQDNRLTEDGEDLALRAGRALPLERSLYSFLIEVE